MEEEKVQIKKFIDDHHRIITIIGVFGALTGFFIVNEIIFGAFFSLMIFLLLSWELWINFPKSEKATYRLQMFEFFFIGLVLALGAYILEFVFIKNKELIPIFDIYVLFGSFCLLFIFLIDKTEIPAKVDKIAIKGKKFGSLIRAIVYLSILGIMFGLAFLIHYSLVYFLK